MTKNKSKKTKLEYVKTPEDAQRETFDLDYNQTVRFVKFQEAFRFNVGDILIMQTNYSDRGWKTKVSGATETPTKFMYVFENEVGIGYIKQLKADGSGFTTLTTCVADIDPTSTRLILDPELVDHLLLSDEGEEFDYGKLYAERNSFRRQAIEKNKKLLLDLSTPELRVNWLHSLNNGDTIWMGWDWNRIVNEPWKVTEIKEIPIVDIGKVLEYTDIGVVKTDYKMLKIFRTIKVTNKQGGYRWHSVLSVKDMKIMAKKPYPLKDDML